MRGSAALAPLGSRTSLEAFHHRVPLGLVQWVIHGQKRQLQGKGEMRKIPQIQLGEGHLESMCARMA